MRALLILPAVAATALIGIPALAADKAPRDTRPPPTAKEKRKASCGGRLHDQAKHARYARSVYRHRTSISKPARRRLSRLRRCQHSNKATANATRLERQLAHWRRTVGIWTIRYQGLAAADRAWLARVASCESGGDPRAIGGGGIFRGKYQFLRSTWASVGGSGDPAAAPEHEQDMRAIYLRRASGTSPWPVCG